MRASAQGGGVGGLGGGGMLKYQVAQGGMHRKRSLNLCLICNLKLGCLVPVSHQLCIFVANNNEFFCIERRADQFKWPQSTFLIFVKFFWGPAFFFSVFKFFNPKPIVMMVFPQKLQNKCKRAKNVCRTCPMFSKINTNIHHHQIGPSYLDLSCWKNIYFTSNLAGIHNMGLLFFSFFNYKPF